MMSYVPYNTLYCAHPWFFNVAMFLLFRNCSALLVVILVFDNTDRLDIVMFNSLHVTLAKTARSFSVTKGSETSSFNDKLSKERLDFICLFIRILHKRKMPAIFTQ